MGQKLGMDSLPSLQKMFMTGGSSQNAESFCVTDCRAQSLVGRSLRMDGHKKALVSSTKHQGAPRGTHHSTEFTPEGPSIDYVTRNIF